VKMAKYIELLESKTELGFSEIDAYLKEYDIARENWTE
jgi:hypothetical protein